MKKEFKVIICLLAIISAVSLAGLAISLVKLSKINTELSNMRDIQDMNRRNTENLERCLEKVAIDSAETKSVNMFDFIKEQGAEDIHLDEHGRLAFKFLGFQYFIEKVGENAFSEVISGNENSGSYYIDGGMPWQWNHISAYKKIIKYVDEDGFVITNMHLERMRARYKVFLETNHPYPMLQ